MHYAVRSYIGHDDFAWVSCRWDVLVWDFDTTLLRMEGADGFYIVGQIYKVCSTFPFLGREGVEAWSNWLQNFL